MKVNTAKLALYETLSIILPDQEQTLLLRACLLPGEAGREAWTEWRERVGNPVEMLRGGNERLKALLPLIFFALRNNGVVVEEELHACLRAAALREQLRINAYRRILSQVISVCAEKQIRAVVVKGAALAETVYESPSLRHSGEIELLVEDADLRRAADSLLSSGFSPAQQSDSQWNGIKLKHLSGLPVCLHRTVFAASYYDLTFDDLWARSRVQTIAEIPARILSPADNLLHVCGSAFFSIKRRSHLWVFDSRFIIDKHPNLDWDELLTTAQRSRLELPLSVSMSYLAEQIDTPIPTAFLERLYAAASETDAEGRANALSIAREETGRSYIKTFFANKDRRTRMYLISWMLGSPIDHLQWLRNNSHPKLFLSRFLSAPLSNLVSRTRLLYKKLAG